MDEDNSTTPTTGAPWRAWGPPEVADALDISVRALWDLRASDKTFPKPRQVGRQLRWCPDLVRAWVRGDDAVAQPEPKAPRRSRGRV